MAETKPNFRMQDGPLTAFLSEHTGKAGASIHADTRETEIRAQEHPASEHYGDFVTLTVDAEGREVTIFLTREQAREIVEKLRGV